MRMEQGAQIIVEDWLKVRRENVFHFITDETKLREADAFLTAAEHRGAVTKLTVLPCDSVQGGDRIEEMRQIMSYADAIIGATNYSFITTNAVDYALRHGARFLSLPLSTNDGSSLFENDFLRMDPREAARMARPMARGLTGRQAVRVTTALGTDITFCTRGRRGGFFNGVAARPGVCASASFEAYVPPLEDSATGRVVLDGSLGYLGLVKEPLELEFQDGYLVKIAATPDGERLQSYLESFGDPEMYCAAELGVGMNRLSRCRGVSYIEDESAYGTFHIGFGRNLALGGSHRAAGHFDIVVHAPDLTADGRPLMRAGRLEPSPLGRLLGRGKQDP